MTSSDHNILDDFSHLKFKAGRRFAWSPSNKTVWYEADTLDSDDGKLALLHEISHSLLNHYSYKSDLHLLKLEVEAWTKARSLAAEYKVEVDDRYIDDCLESYRDWLYRRSICVNCGTNSFQDEKGLYNCHICGARWSVPDSQVCRVIRKKVTKKELPAMS